MLCQRPLPQVLCSAADQCKQTFVHREIQASWLYSNAFAKDGWMADETGLSAGDL